MFGNQNKTTDDIDISESEDREIRFDNPLPPSVNQNVRRKYQMKDNYNRNSVYINSLDHNYRQQEQNWGQQPYNYIDLKNEITQTVTNHTNKLISDLEEKYQQMNKKMEK